MAMLPSSLLLLIYAFLTFVNADFTLPSEVTSLVPSCAQVCFESFVEDNYPTSVCTDTPSLDCLCENASRSSYTVGEGAVQCIMSEANIGFCTGDDASNETVLKAYDMCSSDKSALANTHSTLTATLVLQSGSASVVQIAPIATTEASGSITSTTAPTTTPAPTGSTSSPQAAAATASGTSPKKSDMTLSTAQIAGIVVAGVGGSALALGAILLFTCYRRRRRAKRDSGYLPFQEEPTMSIKSQSHFGISKPMEQSPASTTVRGVVPTVPFLGPRMPPQVPLRENTPSPNPFSQRNAIPDDIGLAMTSESPHNNLLTPGNYHVEHMRGPSPLLPERPVLTLRVPVRPDPNPIQAAAYNLPSITPGINRSSIDTQFEDDDTCSTVVASETPWNTTYSYRSTDKVLEVGAGNLQTMQPIQHPHPTYYQPHRVQDGLSPSETENIIDAYKDPSVEPDFYVRPLNLSQNFSQPRRPENAMKASINRNPSIQYPLTASSSVYSTTSRFHRPPSAEIERLNSLMQSNPSFRRAYRKSSYNPIGPYDKNRASTGSMTSFETMDSINAEPQELPGDNNNLSPVVESPSSTYDDTGKSPVVYPKIKGSIRHSRRGSMISNFPAPPPPAVLYQNTGKPWQEAEITAQKLRMSSLGLQPPNNSAMIRKSEDFFRNSPTLASAKSPSPPPRIPLPPPPTNIESGHMQSSKRRNAPPPPLSLGNSTQSSQSTSSSSQQPQNSKWRILPPTQPTNTNTESEATVALKSPHWRPQILNNMLRKDSTRTNNEKMRKQDATDNRTVVYTTEDGSGQVVVSSELPKTPGWVPKLTPTRRGDDLYLSVA